MADKTDLDALVTELNALNPKRQAPATSGVPVSTAEMPPSEEQMARLRRWLEEVVRRSASDLLLVADAPPSLRIDGVVVPLGLQSGGSLGSEEIEDAVLPALPPHARRMYRDCGIADGSYRDAEVGRFRINLHRERGRAAGQRRN